MGIKIIVTSQYGRLSRGRHSARKGKEKNVVWAERDDNGNLVITEPGTWELHCSDGFNRTAKARLRVDADGGWEMTGDAKRFDVIEQTK